MALTGTYIQSLKSKVGCNRKGIQISNIEMAYIIQSNKIYDPEVERSESYIKAINIKMEHTITGIQRSIPKMEYTTTSIKNTGNKMAYNRKGTEIFNIKV